jgi:pyruvate,water dikinase
MTQLVLPLHDLDRSQVPLAGGKGANLGELSRVGGVRVPPGFCVTTEAFRRTVSPVFDPSAPATEIRAAIDRILVPDDLASEIARRVREGVRYAVRSSATAEDLPTASFAGQHDTYLDVVGVEAVLGHVRRCWASLFTERAVAYRARNGIDASTVRMAVVVQELVPADVSGIMFTAHPVSGNRKVASVEASVGLGEALVSGHVNADVFEVLADRVDRKSDRRRTTLSDEQVRALVRIGRRIEGHFGAPQDIEWCLADDAFQIVQSRAITTLFPIPRAPDDRLHVYVSVGHQQMMTDPLKPLGLSVWQLTTARPMGEAGGRLFVDVTQSLASPVSRPGFVAMFGKHDPLLGDALQTVVDRGDLLPAPDPDAAVPPTFGAAPASIETDPRIVE